MDYALLERQFYLCFYISQYSNFDFSFLIFFFKGISTLLLLRAKTTNMAIRIQKREIRKRPEIRNRTASSRNDAVIA